MFDENKERIEKYMNPDYSGVNNISISNSFYQHSYRCPNLGIR